MRRRIITILAVIAVAATMAVPAGATAGRSGTRSFDVTITNLTHNQWFTPPVVAIHSRAVDLYSVGHPASAELQQIAENGNLDPMLALLGSSAGVADYTVAATAAGPLAPGQSVTVSLESSSPKQRFLSTAAMLICTNDGFTGIDTRPLPGAVGQTAVSYNRAFDAGTEINTEDFADIVPPCPVLSGVPSDVPGTGTSDPALAEGGVVWPHRGIKGIADLTVEDHGWNPARPVVSIAITRTG